MTSTFESQLAQARRVPAFREESSAVARAAALDALRTASSRWFGVCAGAPGDEVALSVARLLRAADVAAEADDDGISQIAIQAEQYLHEKQAGNVGEQNAGAVVAPVRIPLAQEESLVCDLVAELAGKGESPREIAAAILLTASAPVSSFRGMLARHGTDTLSEQTFLASINVVTEWAGRQNEGPRELLRSILIALGVPPDDLSEERAERSSPGRQ